MFTDIFRPGILGSQGHNVTSSTWIEQSIKQKVNEAHKLNPTRIKDNNLGRQITAVHLCAEVPHKLPKGKMSKTNKL